MHVLSGLSPLPLAGEGNRSLRRGWTSHTEDLRIARFHLVAGLLHGAGVILHHLDVLERHAARLVLLVRMERACAADIDDQLLRLKREAEALEQTRGIRVRGILE